MKIITKTLKWLLVLFFLYNTGVLTYMYHNASSKKVENMGHEREDIEFLFKIQDRAIELGDGYTPALYFADLAKIEMRKRHDSLCVYTNTDTYVSALHGLTMERLEKFRRTGNEVAQNNFFAEIALAQKKYDAIFDPHKAERLAKTKRELRDGTTAKKVINWMLIFYLKNFPLALILLYLWWLDERKKWRINNPLSFLICLLIYPYTIIRVLIKKIDYETKHWAMEISFRRTEKTIFTLISEDEMAIIQRFALNSNVNGYKQYLRQRGLIVRHTFVPAMLITMTLLLVAPKVQGKPIKSSAKYFIEVKAPPGIYHHHAIIYCEAIVDTVIDDLILTITKVFITINIKISRGFVKTPTPIPLNDNCLTKTKQLLINKLGEIKNEIFIKCLNNGHANFIVSRTSKCQFRNYRKGRFCCT